MSVLASSVAGAATGYKGRGPVPVAVLVADVVGLWVGLVGGALVASRAKGSGSLVQDFGLRLGPAGATSRVISAGWDLAGGAAVGLLCQYALIPLLYLPFERLDTSLVHQLGRPAQQDTASVHSAPLLVVVLIFLAVGAPIVEELFFRGLVLGSLLRRFGAPVGIVVSALLFAFAHFQTVQFPGLAVFGVVLGLLAWRTGRLGPGIAAHAAFNAGAVISVTHLR